MFFLRTKSLFGQFIICSIMLLAYCTNLNASVVDTSLWKKANDLYEQKRYEEAKNLYEQLVDQGVSSSSLDYNLGNTYYRLNENPLSILFFERALRKNPNDKKILDNLKLAKERIYQPISEVKPVFFVLWWQNLVTFLGIPVLAIISIIIFLALLAMLFLEISGKRAIPYFGRWFSAGIVFFILFLLLYLSGRSFQSDNEAIVLNEKVPFYVDLQSEKAEIYLPGGTKVLIKKQQDNMTFVKLPNGAEGWIDQQSAGKIAE